MKSLISLSIFTVVAVVAWWTITTDNSIKNQTSQIDKDSFIEVYMNDFEMTAMDSNGMPSYTLQGKHMEKRNHSNETTIQQPLFYLQQLNKQWEISADSATVNDINETIQLTHNVIMQQKNITSSNITSNIASSETPSNNQVQETTKLSDADALITIRTPNLLIHTKTQIAETQAMVDITNGDSKLKSNGMTFNNKTNELELSSNVRGSIQANENE